MPEPLYEVVIARYGTRVGRRAEMFLNYHSYGEPDGDMRMDYFVWIVRNDQRTILVDTGYAPPVGQARGRTLLTCPEDVYSALGVRASMAPLIAVTHAHYDHIGNIGLFPDSQLVISQREFQFWAGPYAGRDLFRDSVEDAELRSLRDAGRDGRVRLISGAEAIAPGIEMVDIGGHTPGQSVVKVPTPAGPVLLASDAVHFYEELDRDRPFSVVANLAEMYQALDRIRAMLRSGEVRHVVAGHDPAVFSRLGKAGQQVSGNVLVIGGPGR